MSVLIKGGTVIGPTGASPADVLVDGETIAALFAPGLGPDDTEVIDATGKYVIPGAVDAHTHMELPFGGTHASDTFATPSMARMRVMRESPSTIESASGKAPPASEVPAPRATTLIFCSWQKRSSLLTSSVLEGSTTASGKQR